jgi:hypothetical protein
LAIKSPPLPFLSLSETSHSTHLPYHLSPGALQHLLWSLLAGESSSAVVTVRGGEQMELTPDDYPSYFLFHRGHMPLLFLTYTFPSSRVAGERHRRCPTEGVRGRELAGASCCGEERVPPSLPLDSLGKPPLRPALAVAGRRR